MDVAPHQPHQPHQGHDRQQDPPGSREREPEARPPDEPQSIVVDCDGCVARGLACDDCVVAVLLGPPRSRRELDAEEVSALDALAGAGLVPPLRLVRALDAASADGHDTSTGTDGAVGGGSAAHPRGVPRAQGAAPGFAGRVRG